MNEKVIWAAFKEAGMTDAGAAGLMGNLYAESGLNPGKCEKLCLNRLREYGVGDYTDESYTAAVDSGAINKERFLHPLEGKRYGYGLAQWTTEDRKGGLYKWTVERGYSIADLDQQLKYLIAELKECFKGAWKILTEASDVDAVSDYLLYKYEMPANPSQYVNSRRGYSELYLEKYGEKPRKEQHMGFDREKVIEIAKAEEGYLEKSAAWWKAKGKEGLYYKEAGAGSDNYTKYGYEMHKLYPAVMDFPAAWCDSTVDWCFMQAYGVSNAKKLLGGDFDDYTVASAQLYKDKGAWRPAGVIPERGWQIFFKNSSRICHTGLVVDVVKANGVTYVYTVEGNTSSEAGVVANGGCVRRKKYRWDYDRIAGYGVPAYDDDKVQKAIEFTPHWVRDGAVWYYREAEGKNAHGWKLINSRWYYFDEKGRMQTGRIFIEGRAYYLATIQDSEDYEGACMITDQNGQLHVWDVRVAE